MAFLRGLVRIIDAINEHVGRATAWLMVLMVLIAFVVVLLRYVYGLGWVALQESFVWLHGTVFMMGAAYTLLHDGHVRVDVFYRPASARTKAMINLFGSLFLLMPMILVVLYYSQGFVIRSWDRLEGSSEAGGLPGLFLLKTVIPIFGVLMLLQGVSLIGRSLLVLKGDMRYASSQDEPHEVA
ncbi:MAG: TRAP-type transport system small permease component [Saliniramus fredricksonii]|uniref:TRAP transporter small permease protein n=1 Tax=Saliniramus fredricksonii TaxID=1653334 RepID=A0A0P7X8Q1_9HYPH|nr:TRAP transporter small permease subunit [Saliniramus fredricksonii]KPQ11559.1 MAG: TRAP-type transport system small permease component [Saliniramus fredricksonii]SCC82466.1 TRAP-type mannitol/chloroaromatic compound transport system, small permease component [Saliniramus fredricksonii]